MIGGFGEIVLRVPKPHIGTEQEPICTGLPVGHTYTPGIYDPNISDYSVELNVRMPTHDEWLPEPFENRQKCVF